MYVDYRDGSGQVGHGEVGEVVHGDTSFTEDWSSVVFGVQAEKRTTVENRTHTDWSSLFRVTGEVFVLVDGARRSTSLTLTTEGFVRSGSGNVGCGSFPGATGHPDLDRYEVATGMGHTYDDTGSDIDTEDPDVRGGSRSRVLGGGTPSRDSRGANTGAGSDTH